MRKPFYLIGWVVACGTVITCANFFISLYVVEFAKGEGAVSAGTWWRIAAHSIINMVALLIFSIPIAKAARRSGFGRLISPEDLKFGKRFFINSSFYNQDHDKTYIMFYTDLYPRICMIDGKMPARATHIMVGGDSVNTRFEWVEVSPETVRFLKVEI